LSQKTDKIFFGKVENDGFDLGAQRREIEKNDLPIITKEVTAYLEGLRNGKLVESQKLTYVPKEQILDSTDIGLSYDRYVAQTKWNLEIEHIKLGECCDIFNGSTPVKSNELFWNEGDIPWFTIEDLRIQGFEINHTNNHITKLALEKTSVKLLPRNSVLLCCTASVGACCITNVELTTNQQFNGLVVKSLFTDKLNPKFLFWMCTTLTETLIKVSGKTSFNFVSVSKLKEIEIPLPPIEVQEEIVRELEQYQKIIDGAKQVVDNYKPVIDIDPSWEMKTLSEISVIVRGSSPRPQGDPKYFGGPVPRLMIADITRDGMYVYPKIDNLTELGATKSRQMKKGEVVIAVSGNPGLTSILGIDSCIHDGFVGFRELSKEILPEYLYHILTSLKENTNIQAVGAVFRNLTTDQLKSFYIPVPNLEIQQSIVERIESERQIIEGNKKLIEIYTKKIQERINKIWGE
jgi:restriction endonuclease S subunit